MAELGEDAQEAALRERVHEGDRDALDELVALENVVLLPHMGSATIEGRLEMGEKVLINIKTFDDGHRPPDLVVPAML